MRVDFSHQELAGIAKPLKCQVNGEVKTFPFISKEFI